MGKEEPQLQLDPNPTPKAESQDFSNPDDIRRGQDYAHQLALLDRNQGYIGKLIGSSDSNLTIAFCIIGIAGLTCLGCLVGMIWQPEIFSDALKFFGTVIMTVAGYVFGVKKSDSEK
ncbi:UNVERIFIED_ORG: hypothetical protein J2W66_000109 [Agrobacterium larrymoorei]|nr:hypothetical protein [Agrobacterium larrymoorei]